MTSRRKQPVQATMTGEQFRAAADDLIRTRARTDVQVNAALVEAVRDTRSGAEALDAALAAWRSAFAASGDSLVLNLVEQASMLGVSRAQSTAAKEKNADVRQWVRAQWIDEKRKPDPFSKAAFARAILARIRKEFPQANTITDTTIKTRWLRDL